MWAAALGLNHSLRRAVGNSMEPTLTDGQLVVVLPARLRRPRVGDIVVAHAPAAARVPTWIKRVAAIGPAVFAAPHPVVPGRTVDVLVDDGEVLLLGDNPAESTDGRQYGSTLLDDITHVVVWP